MSKDALFPFQRKPSNDKYQASIPLQQQQCLIQIQAIIIMEIEPRETNTVYRFKPVAKTLNRLINKKLNIVEVDDKLQVVSCLDSESDPTITRAESPLSLEGVAAYFEIEVLRATEEDSINVGLTSKDGSSKLFLGKGLNSFGFLKGELYLEKKKIFSPTTHEKLRAGDRIGIGIDCRLRKFFVVKNEAILHEGVEIPAGWNEFYPAVGLKYEHEKVRFLFDPLDCRFKLEERRKEIQSELNREITNSNNQGNAQVYSLVHEYLRFNHFDETLALLEKKQLGFHRLPRFTNSPSILRSKLDAERSQKNIDEQMNMPLKGRNRVMSQRLNEQQIGLMEVRRKNTEMVIQQSNPRKCSMFSNISNVSNVPNAAVSQPSELIEEQDLQEDSENEHEKFLRVARAEIIDSIKSKKIERAIEIMKEKTAIVFEQSHVMAFLKAHIFLRKVKQQSNLEAIAYSKSERQTLEANYEALCPFFSSKGKVEFKPLKTIFLAMTYNIQAEYRSPQICRDMVSNQQFATFACYIDRLILNKMGYLGCSRLSFITSHIHRIQEKLNEFKGMACGFELTI